MLKIISKKIFHDKFEISHSPFILKKPRIWIFQIRDNRLGFVTWVFIWWWWSLSLMNENEWGRDHTSSAITYSHWSIDFRFQLSSLILRDHASLSCVRVINIQDQWKWGVVQWIELHLFPSDDFILIFKFFVAFLLDLWFRKVWRGWDEEIGAHWDRLNLFSSGIYWNKDQTKFCPWEIEIERNHHHNNPHRYPHGHFHHYHHHHHNQLVFGADPRYLWCVPFVQCSWVIVNRENDEWWMMNDEWSRKTFFGRVRSSRLLNNAPNTWATNKSANTTNTP